MSEHHEKTARSGLFPVLGIAATVLLAPIALLFLGIWGFNQVLAARQADAREWVETNFADQLDVLHVHARACTDDDERLAKELFGQWDEVLGDSRILQVGFETPGDSSRWLLKHTERMGSASSTWASAGSPDPGGVHVTFFETERGEHFLEYSFQLGPPAASGHVYSLQIVRDG